MSSKNSPRKAPLGILDSLSSSNSELNLSCKSNTSIDAP